MALNIKVGLIGLFDMLKFKKLGSNRANAIDAAAPEEIKTKFPINENAKRLHPDYQEFEVADVVDYEKAGAKKFVLKRKDGGKPANFRAGQYLSLKLDIDGAKLTRPISICSSPYDATREGKIEITVKANPDPKAFAATWLLENLKKGDDLLTSDPQGLFYYEDLRDAKTVIALAGGSGITPFLSMAKAIVEGTEDFNLKILFGSRTEEVILFKDELKELEKASDGKVQIIHVLSDEEKKGYEHGFITADLIKKYAPTDESYSVFICGPEAMYKFAEKEVEKLKLPKRLVRCELLGVVKDVTKHPDYKGKADKTFQVTVKQAGEKDKTIPAAADETLLVAFERAGIKAPSRCRSGECGWCRSQLVEGDVFTPKESDGRRHSDIVYNTIHPCATFPLSDCVVEVPGEYWK